MTPEEHRRVRELLGAFCLGHLPAAEALAVQAHLDGCSECRRELAEIAPLADSLTFVSPERVSEVASPAPDLARRIIDAVTVERRARDRHERGRGILLAAAAVLAVALVGGVGVAIGSTTAGSGAPAAPAVPVEAVDVASRRDGVQASAGLVTHTWGVEVKLEAVGLSAGAPYAAVVLTDDGRRRSAGAFVGTGEQTMNCNLNSDVLRSDAVGFEVVDDAGETVLTAEL